MIENKSDICKVMINKALELRIFCTYKYAKMVVIQIYELGNQIYESKLTPNEFGSLLTKSDCIDRLSGKDIFETVLADTYEIEKLDDKVDWIINNNIHLSFTRDLIDLLFEIFTTILIK